ncbi:MAG TPA: hypothetical protein PKE55_02525 [Kiritimatiellia bacterium]|nr:hypothetical protein [Kiritimatiellia bacterium]
MSEKRLHKLLVGLNVGGLMVYVWWLSHLGGKLSYSLEGILVLLPVLPFLFVLSALLRSGESKKPESSFLPGKDDR